MKPLSSGHAPFFTPRFGVELEFLGSSSYDVAEEMNATGLSARSEDYNHNVRNHWKVTSDSSCEWEAVSPPLPWAERSDVVRACRAIRACGGRVNVSTGFHVHHEWPFANAHDAEWERGDIEARSVRMASVLSHYWSAYPIIQHMLAPSRIGNYYAAFRDRESLYTKLTGSHHPALQGDTERYVAVNFTSLERQPTIEFRQHQGTLNPTKALAWVEVTRNLTVAASRLDLDPESRGRLMFEKFTPNTRAYLLDRVPELNTRIAECKSRLAKIEL